MYLHKNREMFRDIIEQTAEQSGRIPIVVEKDYYCKQPLSEDSRAAFPGQSRPY